MPEQDNKEKQLEGEVTTTRSSDESIESMLEGLRAELAGISRTEPLDGEILKPRLIDMIESSKDIEPGSDSQLNTNHGSQYELSYKNSALGKSIREIRIHAQHKRRQKAA